MITLLLFLRVLALSCLLFAAISLFIFYLNTTSQRFAEVIRQLDEEKLLEPGEVNWAEILQTGARLDDIQPLLNRAARGKVNPPPSDITGYLEDCETQGVMTMSLDDWRFEREVRVALDYDPLHTILERHERRSTPKVSGVGHVDDGSALVDLEQD